MPLLLLPLVFTDFDKIIAQVKISPVGCDLVANPVPTCWPVADHKAAHARSQWHFDRQRRRFLEDETALWMKVVDTDDNFSIAGIARWHFYPEGYSFDRDGHWEKSNCQDKKSTDDNTTWNWELHDRILDIRDRSRQSWIPHSPCWVLTHLVTRPDRRGRGVGKMLVQWGLQCAVRSGLRAYLEAGIMATKLYADLGFRKIGQPILITGKSGELLFEMAKMGFSSD